MTPERWKRVREIFDAIVASGPNAKFTLSDCGGDEELYAEVRSMLDEHHRTGFLDRPPVAAAPARAGSPPVFSEGQIVAERYRIVRYLSRGGMGEVYEAEDLDLPEMKEHVALKTLLPAIASDESMVARFKQEIALSRKVQHPNVCAAFDLSRHELEGSNPILFLTMPFLPGETLAARLDREGRMTPETALPLLEQMAEALDAAHKAGVIHRDFKPSNVMLVPAAEGTRAVVTDFGLARRFTTGADSTSTLSANVAGTLDYMSPELLTGSIATFSSDVYALGMVAYKMVTGALPFPDETPLAGAILRAKQPVPPPRTKAADLDPKWDRAILRAVDASPASRFSRAGHFMQALRGEPVSMTVRLPAVTRRRAVAAAVAAVALIGTLAAWRTWRNERNRPSDEAMALYRTGVDDIHAGAYFAATKALGEAVKRAPRYALAHARLAEAWVGLEMPEKAGGEMLLVRRQDTSGLPKIDQLQIEAVDLTITREFPAAVAKYEQVAKMAGAEDAGLYVDLGRAYEAAGKPDKAIASYRKATEGPLQSPAAWLRLAIRYFRASDIAHSDTAFRRAEELYTQTSSLEGLTELAYQRAVVANRRGQLDVSGNYLKQAMDTARLAGNIQQQIKAKLLLANNSYVAGDSAAAERLAREALDTAQANQMETLAIYGLVTLGNAYFRKLDFAGSEKYYDDALTLARRNSSSRLVALSLLSLASLHDHLKRPDEATREAQEALDYFQPNRWLSESLNCLTILGRAQRQRGNYAAAVDSFQRLLALAEQARDNAQIAVAHEGIAHALASQDRYPEALKHYEEYLNLSKDPENLGYARMACGNTLAMLGRYAEAQGMFDQAEPSAERFASLRASLIDSRASMALSEERFSDAAALARRALAANSQPDPATVASLKGILGLALASSGNKKEGLSACKEAAAESAKIEDASTLRNASLNLMQALLLSGDRAGALSVFRDVQPALGRHPESQWRALALASHADSQFTVPARQALDELKPLWGAETFALYTARRDIHRLSWPLLQSVSARQ